MEQGGEDSSSSSPSSKTNIEVSVVSSPQLFGEMHPVVRDQPCTVFQTINERNSAQGDVPTRKRPCFEKENPNPVPTHPCSLAEDQKMLTKTITSQVQSTVAENRRDSLCAPATGDSTLAPSLSSEQIVHAFNQWQWVSLDDVQLPAVVRGDDQYLAVHMVQLKLLSKFPADIPQEIMTRFTMVSHKMTLAEAWTFNSINTVLRKFDLGCQLLSPQDEIVRLSDVQLFYWNVKSLNLHRVVRQYDDYIASLGNENTTNALFGMASSLQKQVLDTLKLVQTELDRLMQPHYRNKYFKSDENGGI